MIRHRCVRPSWYLFFENSQFPALKPLTIGIDAANLRYGGGRTHLIELLRAAAPENHGIGRVVVWGAQGTLDLLDDRAWLVKRCPAALNAGLLRRTLWQRFRLGEEARREQCHLLFVPGGSYAGTFRPVITMSQTLLPFNSRSCGGTDGHQLR